MPIPADCAPEAANLGELDSMVAACRSCPRLVDWREHVARSKRAAFRDQEYWGRPVPGFGPADAALGIVGLAPAAHGANRTGRMFTGDRSGEVLYAALHDVGLASTPQSRAAGDGLRLYCTRITAPVRCAPPANKPTPAERDACRPWLRRELELLRPTLRAVVVLGGYGWQALLPALADAGWIVPTPRPRFGHDSHTRLLASDDGADLHLLGCYHVSQQNTFTGRLTPAMLREVLSQARDLAGIEVGGAVGDLSRADAEFPECSVCSWVMTVTPEDALRRLRTAAETGELGALCARHEVDLLVVHGSVLDPEPLRPAGDLDVAFRSPGGVRDVLGLVNELIATTGFDRIDPMDLGRAGVVARARALDPRSLPLYEASPGTFATAQMAALTTEMETRPLRRLDLELMAER